MYKEFKIFVFLLSFALSLTTSFATTYYVIRESGGSCSEGVIADYNDLDQYSCEGLGNGYCAKVSGGYAKCYDDGDEDQSLSFVLNNCTNAGVFCKLQNMEITFNSLGGYNVGSIIIGKSNSRQYYEYFQLPIATRDGYIFKGWCRGNSSCSTALNGSEKYMPHQSRIYYAQWVQGYTVTYDTQQGDAIPSVTKESGQSVTLPTATRDGYIFKGWCKGETTCTSPLSSGENETVTENVTYYAQWEENYIPTASKYQKIYITGFNGDTSGQLIQINNQEWDDLELYFLQSDGNTVNHFTIMDRNLGATEVYNGQYVQDATKINTASFGYHYQRGNNYGFEPCINNPLTKNSCATFPKSETTVGTIAQNIWSAYSPSKYARNTWSTSLNWMASSSASDNIWGGGGDTTGSNHDNTLIGNNNDWSILSGRQGPCPDSYYIPSAYDWLTLKNAWGNATSSASNGTQFASDLLLPPAGSRNYEDKIVYFQGNHGLYWSSSPYPNPSYDNHAQGLSFYSSSITPLITSYRSSGNSVRCAKSSPNTPTFTLHANGGTKAVVAFTGTVGGGKFTTLGTPTKNGGYEFDGWYTANEGGEKLGVGSGVVSDIYARWACPEGKIDNGSACVDVPKNTVTFDYSTNSGNAATLGSVEVISGSTLNLSLYTGTKAGWDFVGWSETSGTTGVLTSNPVIATDKTLYAVFSKDLEVTYLSGVGVASIGVDTGNCKIYNKETSCTVKTPTITLKDGYGTGVWSTGSNVVNPGSDITLTADDTYTASATPNTYTVSYNANGGIGSIASSGYTYDLSGNLAENTFTKTGYVFSGWMYNNEIYTGNQEIKNLTGINDATIIMVTQWKPITYSVEFTGTDVSGTMDNQEFTYDIPQNLTGNAFTKTGYIFSGWTYGTTGYADKQNVSNLTTTDGATVTLTAQWTPIIYTISFSGNAADATGTAPATINAEYDSGDIAPDNSFTLTGYTFTGWNTESDGSGTGYTTGAELKNLTITSGANVELYAQWEVNVHKLNFVVDGTTIQSGDVAYSGTISAPAEPKKDCNSFAGWTSSVEGLTTTGTMPDSDVTFTANWNYTCSRSSGGGGGGSSRNTEKTTETQTGSKVDSSTKATDNEDNTQDSSAKASEGQNQGKTYSDEFQQAYEFAYKHGITTMPTIEQANMEGPLTRIAMAKMLSYYAINVLGLKPDETRVNKFNDVSDQMDAEYNNAVTLAYQLGIMGINMPKNKFRPNDLVTRAEFATALSRMLYKIADGKDKYYSTHMAKLMEEKIITKDNPNLQELRGYVMIMLMRSAK